MTDYRTYIAKPGILIRDPLTRVRVPHVAPGLYVVRTPFWVRRENDGDVIDITPKAEAEANTKRVRAKSED